MRFGFVIFTGEIRLIIQPGAAAGELWPRAVLDSRTLLPRHLVCSAICVPRSPAGHHPPMRRDSFSAARPGYTPVPSLPRRTFDTFPNVPSSYRTRLFSSETYHQVLHERRGSFIPEEPSITLLPARFFGASGIVIARPRSRAAESS